MIDEILCKFIKKIPGVISVCCRLDDLIQIVYSAGGRGTLYMNIQGTKLYIIDRSLDLCDPDSLSELRKKIVQELRWSRGPISYERHRKDSRQTL